MRNRSRLLVLISLTLFLHLSYVAYQRHTSAPWSELSDVPGINVSQDPIVNEVEAPGVDHHPAHAQPLFEEDEDEDEDLLPEDELEPLPVAAPAAPIEEDVEEEEEQAMDEKEQAKNEGEEEKAPPSPWCQYNECTKGRWVPRDPPFTTLAEFRAVFASRSSTPWSECPIQVPALVEGKTEEEVSNMKRERLLKVMNYVWKPERGKQVTWDAEDLVIRLLRSPGGVIFVGDSVTAGWEHAFFNYLEQGVLSKDSGIAFEFLPTELGGKPTDAIRAHVLRPNHPKTLELQQRAGVPDSRMARPVFQVIEDHMLISDNAVRGIIANLGGVEGWKLDALKRAEGWEEYLENLVKPKEGEEEAVKDDSIVIVNNGAHWSRSTLWALPQRGSITADQEMLADGYKQMMELVIEQLNKLRQTKLIYRSTTPGHPRCGKKTVPYSSYTDALEGESNFVQQISDWMSGSELANTNIRDRLIWDWDSFNLHNDIWRKEAVPRLNAEREQLADAGVSVEDLPPKWLFMDFWEMALQRPDAHADCLHWCLPAMYNEWTQHLLHVLHLEDGLR